MLLRPNCAGDDLTHATKTQAGKPRYAAYPAMRLKTYSEHAYGNQPCAHASPALLRALESKGLFTWPEWAADAWALPRLSDGFQRRRGEDGP